MEQTGKYGQLKPEERVAIASLKLRGKAVRETAQALGRSAARHRRSVEK